MGHSKAISENLAGLEDNTILIRCQVQTNPKIDENFVFLKLISELVHIKFQAKFLGKSYASVFLRRLQIYVSQM